MNIFITGGAGFIGVHTANYYLSKGDKITIFDNFFRNGTRENMEWLEKKCGVKSIEVIEGDVRDFEKLKKSILGHDVIIHLAGQVAVTTSVVNPREDFEINALGTFNVLEAVRLYIPNSILLFASTNKVYGGMEEIKIIKKGKKYIYRDLPGGIAESQNLDFHSPYGCSKGTADQYVRDYHRIYGLKTVVFRQSCIYGTHQFGIEDQGWVSWFTIAAVLGKPITVYGDGMQVRDVLFVEDLVRAYDTAVTNIDKAAGKIYNVGGGPEFTLSLLELLALLEKKLDRKIPYAFADWRPGDQPVYVSNISKIKKELGWDPKIDVAEGTSRMIDWIVKEKDLIEKVLK
ncbi:GDP-mannose 4,6-dehydratase [Candidatus Collierbacteria bacterium]|nr:GDP-mannose 4,6-dehydratase [Candidatus Collierbacteria bacterium]